jgi:hypothetical protein
LLHLKIRKIIAVFLLLVLSAQLLPMKQTIVWLLGGQATEELAHAENPGRTGDDWQKDFLPVSLPTLEYYSHIPTTPLHPIHFATLPLRHADDILTPPPNRPNRPNRL